MGKALVIDGLQVTNPLCVVTIDATPADTALKAYYQANTSILDAEKTALNDLVNGLIDYEIWDKVKYFYPLIGGNVTDAILEGISPSTEDLFVAEGTTGLSIIDRVLNAGERPLSGTHALPVGSRAKQLDPTKIGFIMAGRAANSSANWGQMVRFSSGTSLGFAIETHASNDKYEQLMAGSTNINNTASSVDVLERVAFGNIKDGMGYVYRGTELRASAEVDLSSYNMVGLQTYGVLTNISNNVYTNYKYDFFAIVEGMTNEEWTTKFYPLLYSFLQAIGRRTA